jgi:hypothetical protein
MEGYGAIKEHIKKTSIDDMAKAMEALRACDPARYWQAIKKAKDDILSERYMCKMFDLDYANPNITIAKYAALKILESEEKEPAPASR